MWAPTPTMHTELSYAITTTMEEARTDGNKYAVKRQRDIRRTYVTTSGIHSPRAYTLVKETHTVEDCGKQNFALSNGMDSNWLHYAGQPPAPLQCQYPIMQPIPPACIQPHMPTPALKSCMKSPRDKPSMFLGINQGYVMSVTPPAPTPLNPQSSFFMSVDAEQNRDGTQVNLNFFNLQAITTNPSDKEDKYGTNGCTMDLDNPKTANVGIQAGSFFDENTPSGANSSGGSTPVVLKAFENNETQTPDLKGGHTEVDDTSEAEETVSEFVNNYVNDLLKNVKSE